MPLKTESVHDDEALKAIARKEPATGTVVYKLFATGPTAVKAIKRDDFTADIVISSAEIDRDKEIVDPKGLTVSKPKRVPLVAGHAYGDLRKHIGDVPKIRVEGEEVVARPRWLTGMGNPEADWAWTLVTEGLAAFSIGFLPIEWQTADLSDEKVLERIRTGKEPVRRYTKWELAEVSQVIVPSNRTAIQRMVEAGVMTQELAAPLLAKSKEEPMGEAATKAFDAALAAFKVSQEAVTVVEKAVDVHVDVRVDDARPASSNPSVDDALAVAPGDDKGDADLDAVDDKSVGDPEPEVPDPWKAIEDALAFQVKPRKTVEVEKTWRVGGARSLVVSDHDSWDAVAARSSLGDDLAQANVLARWKAAHVVFDSAEPENKGSYKLPFARVIDGRLRASRRGLQAVRVVLADWDLPDNVRATSERFVASYLGKPEESNTDQRIEEAVARAYEAAGLDVKVAKLIKEQNVDALREVDLKPFVTQEQMKQTIRDAIAELVAHIDAVVGTRIAQAQGNVDAYRKSAP